MGEIGGNDYNYAFFVGGNIKQLKASVPFVVEAITQATSVCNIHKYLYYLNNKVFFYTQAIV